MSYLLDTDICSAFIKGNRQVWQKMMQHSGPLHDSAVTAAELFAWVLRANASPNRQQAVLDFFNDVTFLDINRVTLVTHSTRDFTDVPGLALEDWLTPIAVGA